MLLASVLFLLILNLCVMTSVHNTIMYNIKMKYRKIKSLKRLVESQHKNILKIMWVTFCIILKTFYISICQYLNRSVSRLDKNTYEVSYSINGILYKMIVKPRRGPKCIIEAVDEHDNDITPELLAYMGPMENFHGGTEITPTFLNKQKITLNLTNGNEITFEGDQVINMR
jgi:hypothetical protein